MAGKRYAKRHTENGRVIQNTALKFRLYPTVEQAKLFDKTFDCCRYVWNQMLSDEREFYFAADEHFIPTPAHYKKDAPFLREVDSQALVTVHQNLRRAFLNFFDPSCPYGYPAFKTKARAKNTYTTFNNSRGTRIVLTDKGIKLPKLGVVKARLHRKPLHWWKLKSATVTKTLSSKYFCSLLYEYSVKEQINEPLKEDKIIGLNYSASHFYVDSNGNMPEPPNWLKKSEKRLIQMQKKLSRMERGSKNYEAQLQKIRLLNEHIKNQRLDFAHKESRRIADHCEAVCVRDTDLAETAKKLKTIKVYDSGFGRFRLCLQYKLERQGKPYIVVDKFYPSAKTCHICGYTREDLLAGERTWKCQNCGAVHQRELNAAKNIKLQGLKQLQKEQSKR